MTKKKKNTVEKNPVENFFEDHGISHEEEFVTPEFSEKIINFEKKFKNARLVKIHKLIGSPKIISLKDIRNDSLKEEYEKLIELLTLKNIYVHFKNEYPLIEKYNFISREILNQEVENLKDTNLHINFIYEDFYPELDNIDEEEI